MADDTLDLLPPELRPAFEERGYTSLTAVQAAVLRPEAEGRDLRITSQTGSGKTVAIGLVLRSLVTEPSPPGGKRAARPRALVIAPTRELGRQVEDELAWLYGPMGVKVVALTGGASYRDEHRALASGPTIVVATPGRLIDHLEHGSVDPSAIAAVVLDEADRMLDMGFAEALATILSKVPEGRRTHLVSATFPSDVRGLADRVQNKPMHVEGTRLGAANLDIEHLLVLVDGNQRLDALVNMLLWHQGARTLVFARTRADVAELASLLDEAGFGVSAISGELAQTERTRALSAFKRGTLPILVATDVAARGIDVSEVALVVHMETPTAPDAYTHRAGRTGRAGKKGTSAVLVPPRDLMKAQRVMSRANIQFRIVPAPTPGAVRARQDDRLVETLTQDDGTEIDARSSALAERLASRGDVDKTLARILASSGLTRGPDPREIRVLLPPAERARSNDRGRPYERMDAPERPRRNDRPAPEAVERPRRDDRPDASERLRRDRPAPDADERPRRNDRPAPERGPAHDRAPVTELPPPMQPTSDRFVPFQISVGARQGAEPRRLLAMMCRRGEIESKDVGAIRIGEASSIIEVREHLADHFREMVMRPDPRDPAVRVRPALSGPPRGRPFPAGGPGEAPPRRARPSPEGRDAPRGPRPRR